MSVSLYYTATRDNRLTDAEKAAIDKIVTEYDVSAEADKYFETGEGYNWETFTIYDEEDYEDDVIFDGATKTPSNTPEAMMIGMQHWLKVVSLIRNAVPDADWTFQLDDMEIPWDEESQEYNLEMMG